MISISAAVTIIVLLIAGAIIFALLQYAINYSEKQFPDYPMFFKIARVILVLLSVLVII